MEITYHQEPHIPSSTEIGFCLWNMEKLKKFYLTANNRNIYVPEMGKIPEECIFHLCVSAKDFEDAVLELANKIAMDRAVTLGAIPRGSQRPAEDEVHPSQGNSYDSLIENLVGIIQKLVEK